jgi:hypothetical protein
LDASVKRSTWLALSLQLASAGVLGCGGDSPSKATTPEPTTGITRRDASTATTSDASAATATPDVDTSSAIPFTLPGGSSAVVNALYSGFDGVHDYQLPLTSLVPNVKFSIEDESIAELRKTEAGVMIKTKKAGTTSVVGKAGNIVGKISLKITAFTPDDWIAGNKRYNNMTSAIQTIYPCEPTGVETGLNPNASCSECHRKSTLSAVIQHSPTQTAGYSDEEITTIFTMAMKPKGWKQHFPDLGPFWKMFHKWTMPPDQARGLISYLRALEPTDMGEFTDMPPPQEEDVPVTEASDTYTCMEADGGTRTVSLSSPDAEKDAGI